MLWLKSRVTRKVRRHGKTSPPDGVATLKQSYPDRRRRNSAECPGSTGDQDCRQAPRKRPSGPQSGFKVSAACLSTGGKAMLTVQYLLSQVGDGRWQDVMLSAGNIFFCFTLIPMLRQPERPPLLTCIPSGLVLLAGGFVFATLHLWLTALTQTITGLQWLALVFKRPPKAASSLDRALEARRRVATVGGSDTLRQGRTR